MFVGLVTVGFLLTFVHIRNFLKMIFPHSSSRGRTPLSYMHTQQLQIQVEYLGFPSCHMKADSLWGWSVKVNHGWNNLSLFVFVCVVKGIRGGVCRDINLCPLEHSQSEQRLSVQIRQHYEFNRTQRSRCWLAVRRSDGRTFPHRRWKGHREHMLLEPTWSLICWWIVQLAVWWLPVFAGVTVLCQRTFIWENTKLL